MTVNDFGVKIGGARKDTWKNGLSWEDTFDMTEAEKSKFVKRDNIWPKPDVKGLYSSGIERIAVYFREEIRKSVYPTPRTELKSYVEGVKKIRSLTEKVKTEDDIGAFYHSSLNGEVFTNRYRLRYNEGMSGVVNANKFLQYFLCIDRLKRKMEKDHFLMTDDEVRDNRYIIIDTHSCEIQERDGRKVMRISSPGSISYYYDQPDIAVLEKVSDNQPFVLADKQRGHVIYAGASYDECAQYRNTHYSVATVIEKGQKKRKEKWVPVQLEEIVRTGTDYRFSIPHDGDDLIEKFGIRGGEFGNWTNERDRQVSLNMAYDALLDLAKALDISCQDIGLRGLSNGSLALAFGARGMGATLAHYEPMREVINITKKRGAGSLSHEWGHALDDFIGKVCGCKGFASENLRCQQIPKEFRELIHSFKLLDGKLTNYYVSSERFDKLYSKQGNGYWSSSCEMFARAFACYVLDRTEGRSDYLSGHAEAAIIEEKDEVIVAYPQGKERDYYNEQFQLLFEYLRKENIFTHYRE